MHKTRKALFVDLQVNGFAGVDFNDPVISVDDVGLAIAAMRETGVGWCLPTVITGPPDRMLACLENLRRAQREMPEIAGFHVEGPHIGPEDGPRGAHPAQWVRRPDFGEFERWQNVTGGNIRLITISPHWPEAARYIEAVVKAGTVVGIGHTGANSAQIREAVDAGASLSTHLGNAAQGLMPKIDNCIWDQLADDRLSASFIADGIHVPDPFLRAAVRAKGLERTVLVTDAAAPAGAAPGPYRLGELDVELTDDDRVVLRGTRKLAGSALRLNRAIEHLMRVCDITYEQVLPSVTTNPARLIGLSLTP